MVRPITIADTYLQYLSIKYLILQNDYKYSPKPSKPPKLDSTLQ